MKIRLAIVGLLLLTGTDLLACGEKFLIGARGLRFQRVAVKRASAAILINADPSTSPVPGSYAQIEKALQRAGYRAVTVTTAAALEDALRTGRWDLVVTAVAGNRVNGPGQQPAVVLIKAPVKPDAVLDSVDDVVVHGRTPSHRP